ncbi:hypothetical protein [Winogradskya humida]|uniref:Uncharacterized protein n=1 Tax=Winogradskya humida TaxID=113566 RepID=A0ABQ3ZZA5_9ACTN|nr:hypothetical protein [Actinoplanes humidus]GIE23914.1 hypothetical protein Ahu01nite_070160 [Actinoplanes humidus]
MPTTVKRLAIGLTSLTAIVAGFGIAATPPGSLAAVPSSSTTATAPSTAAAMTETEPDPSTNLTIRLEPLTSTAKDC